MPSTPSYDQLSGSYASVVLGSNPLKRPSRSSVSRKRSSMIVEAFV